MTGFGERLRALREARSLTQEELAERAGLTVKAVGALERGERKRPYPHTVRSLADALGLDEADRTALVGSVPARTSAAPPPSGLPAPSGPLVGRVAALAELSGLLTAGGLVTLVGPGGVGKTTLALAAARSVPGAVFVDLAPVTDPEAVLPAIGRALAAPETATTAAGLAPYLDARRLLLVLDNLEQVLDCAAEVAALVGLCPELTVLATSRAALRVRAERVVPVPPLDAGSARALLVDRVRAAGAPELDPATVDELCRRLDGVPLALELAASAARLLGPSALLARLGALPDTGPLDLPERHRTMTAALDWSLDLLEPGPRALLGRLAVVPGSFPLELAEPADELYLLLDHSLVTRVADVAGTARFRLLEPVREHVGRGDGEAALASYVVASGAALAEDLRGAGLVAALDLLEADHASLVLVLGHADVPTELAGDVWPYLALRGHAREVLALYDALPPTAPALVGRAGLRYVLGDVVGVRADAEAALALGESAEARVLAGSGALFTGDLDGARAHLAAVAGAPWPVAHGLIASGQVALLADDLAEAERLFTEALARARALGNAFTLATALNLMATLTEVQERHAESAVFLAESAALSVGASIRWTFAYTLPALAGVAVRLGEPALGARLFGASASYSDQHSVATAFQTVGELADRDLAHARELLGPAAFGAAWDAGRDSTPEDVVAVARELSRSGPG